MLPMKNSTIFKSRWMALLWAAGIIWFAYDVAESQPKTQQATANAEQASDDSNSPTNTDDEKKLAEALKSF